MATVIGKQSQKIDELLADLLKNAIVRDGNLILIQNDGGEINAGGVGGPNSVHRIFYANGAWPTRPSGTLCVEWVGPTLPPAMTPQDSWMIVP